MRYDRAGRRGLASSSNMAVTLVVLTVGIAAGYFYQDNPSLLSQSKVSVTTTYSTTYFTSNGVTYTVTEQHASTELVTTTSTSTASPTFILTQPSVTVTSTETETVNNTVTTTTTSTASVQGTGTVYVTVTSTAVVTATSTETTTITKTH